MIDIIIDALKDNFAMIQNVVVGGGIALALKFISNEKLYSFGNGVGVMITLGLSKFAWWSKVEDWLINGVDVLWQGIIHGLRSDDSNENEHNRDVEYAKK